MCSGKGTPGSSTRSSGNSGKSVFNGFPSQMILENDSLIVTPHLDLHWPSGYKPRMDLSGRVAVITGASMGIGEAIAKLFADHGAQVVMLSRDTGRAEAARARIGHPEHTLALACDVRHREEIDRVVGLTVHHFKSIDIWVNNAGHGLLGSIAGVKMADLRELFETNLFGTVDGMQAVIPI